MEKYLKYISDNILLLGPALAAIGGFFRWIYLGFTKNKKDKITLEIETQKLILQNMKEITQDLADAYKSTTADKRILNFMFSNCPESFDKARVKFPEYFKDE